MTQTPVSLLQRLRESPSQEAWGHFVDLYTPLLHYWARNLGLQSADVNDLVQEVLVTLVRKMPVFDYQPGKSFRAWLRTVLRNKWAELCRRDEPMPQTDATVLLRVTDNVEAFWEDEYRQHLVKRALELMRADFGESAWRACWEVVANRRPAAEVATELNLTVGAVHAARFRILSRLRQELEGMMD